MQRIPRQLSSKELTTGSVTQYTAPANTYTTISAATATNKSGTAYYLTITQTPSGGSAKYLAYQLVIAAGETKVLAGMIGQTLEAANVLAALAEANSAIDLVISGYEANR